MIITTYYLNKFYHIFGQYHICGTQQFYYSLFNYYHFCSEIVLKFVKKKVIKVITITNKTENITFELKLF